MDYKEYKKQALEAFNEGNSQEIIRWSDLAIEIFAKEIQKKYKAEEFAELHHLRGIGYHRIKNYNKALDDLNKSIELNPNDEEVYMNRGSVFSDIKNYNKALDDFNKAIELNPNVANIYYNRGLVYCRVKFYEKAITDYNQAIKLEPNDVDAYHNRGVCYHEQKYYNNALVDYNKVLALNPNYASAYSNRGFLYAELKQYDKALADYNQAIVLNQIFPNAYYNLALCYEDLNNTKLAEENYTKMFNVFQKYSALEEEYKSIRKEKAISIFKFSPLNAYTLKTLMQEKLFLARPHKDWNDPHDCNITSWTKLAHDIFKQKARLQCFFAGEEPFKKILMWSHYADKHKGICVEYEYTASLENTIAALHEVKYQEEVEFNELGDTFKIKATDWQYENEVRLFHFDENNTEDKNVTETFAKLGLKIKAVYFGERLSKEDEDMITIIQNIFKYKEEVRHFLETYQTLNIWSVDAIKTLLSDIQSNNPNKQPEHDVKFYKMTTKENSFVLNKEEIGA